jgi:hypothetical protein
MTPYGYSKDTPSNEAEMVSLVENRGIFALPAIIFLLDGKLLLTL